MYSRHHSNRLFTRAKQQQLACEQGKPQIQVVGKYLQTEFTLAIVNYKLVPSDENDKRIDFTLFIVYDHRENDKLENIAKFLMGDVLRDEKNLFFDLI
jgi:hypothetical protein